MHFLSKSYFINTNRLRFFIIPIIYGLKCILGWIYEQSFLLQYNPNLQSIAGWINKHFFPYLHFGKSLHYSLLDYNQYCFSWMYEITFLLIPTIWPECTSFLLESIIINTTFFPSSGCSRLSPDFLTFFSGTSY